MCAAAAPHTRPVKEVPSGQVKVAQPERGGSWPAAVPELGLERVVADTLSSSSAATTPTSEAVMDEQLLGRIQAGQLWLSSNMTGEFANGKVSGPLTQS